jgi:hypothetical protein
MDGMSLEELKQKIDTFQMLDKELSALGKCESSNDTSGRDYFHFGVRGLMELCKKFGLSVEIEKNGSFEYPYRIISHDLKAFSISTPSDMLKCGVIETTEGFEGYTLFEKEEFAEMKAKLMALETENGRLKERVTGCGKE